MTLVICSPQYCTNQISGSGTEQIMNDNITQEKKTWIHVSAVCYCIPHLKSQSHQLPLLPREITFYYKLHEAMLVAHRKVDIVMGFSSPVTFTRPRRRTCYQ